MAPKSGVNDPPVQNPIFGPFLGFFAKHRANAFPPQRDLRCFCQNSVITNASLYRPGNPQSHIVAFASPQPQISSVFNDCICIGAHIKSERSNTLITMCERCRICQVLAVCMDVVKFKEKMIIQIQITFLT